LIYNHPMAQLYLHAVRVAIWCSLLSVSPRILAADESLAAKRPAAESSSLRTAHLRVDASLVLIPVQVTTAEGTPVTALTKQNFQLFEDNQEQKITYFVRDDAPVSIGVLFDASGSMHNKMRVCAQAAASFLKTANAEDEFFLVEFSDRPKLTVPFTRDPEEIHERIGHIRPFGRTALLDAIHLALDQMKNARHLRKAIVIISDGGDNRSRNTPGQIKTAMLESDVQVYAMGIFDPGELRRLPREEANGPELLDELADSTGGRSYPVRNLNELPEISANIGNQLRDEYLLGYVTTNDSRDGKYHQVKLKLAAPLEMPNLRTFYRRGYYAPSE
jgi:Ca-activated chloride channel family protein